MGAMSQVQHRFGTHFCYFLSRVAKVSSGHALIIEQSAANTENLI